MTHETKVTEATLLYPSNPAEIFRRLDDRLANEFQKSGLGRVRKLTTQDDLAISIGGVTIAMSRVDCALGKDRFDAAQRPENTTTNPQQVLTRLFGHRAAIVVRVTGPDEAASPETRQALCYIAVIQILALSTPGLIHWSKSNTLYTYEELLGRTGTGSTVLPRPAALVPRAKRQRQIERPKPSSILQRRKTTTAYPPRMAPAQIVTVRRRHLQTGKGELPSVPRPTRLNAAMTQGAILGLTAPFGLVLQNLLTGLKLG